MAYAVLGVLVVLGGVAAIFGAQSAFHEIVGGTLLTAGAVFIVGGAIVSEVRRNRRVLEQIVAATSAAAVAAETRHRLDREAR